MENWENHIHLSLGLCFQMYFNMFQQVVEFKVIKSDNFGNKTGRICSTGDTFEFNVNNLLKVEYSTLVEFSCNNC